MHGNGTATNQEQPSPSSRDLIGTGVNAATFSAPSHERSKDSPGPCPNLMACVNTIADHLAPHIARALSSESGSLTVEDGTGGQLGGVVRACESDYLSLRIPSCSLCSYESHCSSHGTSFIDRGFSLV